MTEKVKPARFRIGSCANIWSPEDLFKPNKVYPQGSSGEWMAEENGVMVKRIYKNGKLVATEVFQLEEPK